MEDDTEFIMTEKRMALITAMNDLLLKEKRLQMLVPRRRYGISRLIREIQKRPNLFPNIFNPDARIAVVEYGKWRAMSWNHLNFFDLLDASRETIVGMFTGYDGVIFDNCKYDTDGAAEEVLIRVSSAFRHIPIISIGCFRMRLSCFGSCESQEVRDEMGFVLLDKEGGEFRRDMHIPGEVVCLVLDNKFYFTYANTNLDDVKDDNEK